MLVTAKRATRWAQLAWWPNRRQRKLNGDEQLQLQPKQELQETQTAQEEEVVVVVVAVERGENRAGSGPSIIRSLALPEMLGPVLVLVALATVAECP